MVRPTKYFCLFLAIHFLKPADLYLIKKHYFEIQFISWTILIYNSSLNKVLNVNNTSVPLFFFICICMSIFIRNYKEKLHRFLHRGWPKSGMQKWKHNFLYYNNNFKKVNNTIRNLEEYYILSEQIVFLLPLTLVFFRTTHGFLHFADSATGCLYIKHGLCNTSVFYFTR